MSAREPPEVDLILLGIGASLFVIGVFAGIYRSIFVARALPTQGRVVGNRRFQGRKRRAPRYAPDVEYLVGGERFVCSPNIAAMQPYVVGSMIGVLYDPQRPGKACLDRFTHKWFWPVFLAILGAIFTATGAMLLVIKMRR